MAIELHIFFAPTTPVPTTVAWQNVISELGFPTVLDKDNIELQTHTGFWPATFKGKQTGFETYLESAEEYVATYPQLADHISDRGHCATFRFRGDLFEMCAALSAGAALTKLTDGVYFYPEDNVICKPNEAVRAVKHDLSALPL